MAGIQAPEEEEDWLLSSPGPPGASSWGEGDDGSQPQSNGTAILGCR